MHRLLVLLALATSFNVYAATITVVVGHDARVDAMLEYIAGKDGNYVDRRNGLVFADFDESVFITPDASASTGDVANALKRGGHVLVVIDAALGYDQTIFEHLVMARQLKRRFVSIYITNVDAIEAEQSPGTLMTRAGEQTKRLLRLLELPANANVFHERVAGDGVGQSSNGYGRDFAFDTVRTLKHGGLGMGWVEKRHGRRLLTHAFVVPEHLAKHTIRIEKGTRLTLWLDGDQLLGVADSDWSIEPGADADLDILLDEAVTYEVPDGFFIEDQGHVVGGGAVSDILPE